jgi:sigma-B regulation protein RsbU (phosphoserine phosphatase)
MGVSRPHHILVVDDDPGLRRTLTRVLEPPYRVEAVAGATEALARVEAEPFDLALVDVRLKDGDGYSLCKALRERSPRGHRIDVILITGSISEPDEKLFRSLEEGAFYFLFKPFDRRVLLALVERCLRLKRERASKERYAEALQRDLEKARLFQQSLVPREPLCGAGWRVEGRMRSCEDLGGDFYLTQADELGLVFAVCDVVGHGVSAAMYAGMLRSTLGAAWRRGAEPEEVSRELLANIDFLEGRECATMVYGNLLPDGRVRAWNAGHPPILCRRADGAVELFPATGCLLHTAFRFPRQVGELTFAPGDRLLAYTDGAFEVLSPLGEELGRDRLTSLFSALGTLPLGEALDELMVRIDTHGAGRPLADDITLVMAERTG